MSVLVPTKFPSVAAVMLACIASLCLLLLARIMYAFMRFWTCPAVSTASDEKTRSWSSLLSLSNSWSRSLRSTLPTSLPFSLTIPEKPLPGVGTGTGVGLSPKRLESQPGSQFQLPREPKIIPKSSASVDGKAYHVATHLSPPKSKPATTIVYRIFISPSATDLPVIPLDSIALHNTPFPRQNNTAL
ncbi:hypothetical protein AZE42_07824 [Rhizopogon vesiculosus]|uniref:Uncharacterized protein n=1 Tax=Rhizopogon vesiculosus TaxID=180088 RepID=A0A1J8PPR2_9AGAM|nr:hypothetical protein AZE42_07824 [Rhizopogon vesiculosus]